MNFSLLNGLIYKELVFAILAIFMINKEDNIDTKLRKA
jgi:hypothetical protein